MTIITAKQLRNDMQAIFKRVQAGEEILVKYRNTPPIKLTPHYDVSSAPIKGMPGLDALLAAPKEGRVLEKGKTYKQIYRKHLEEKYSRQGR